MSPRLFALNDKVGGADGWKIQIHAFITRGFFEVQILSLIRMAVYQWAGRPVGRVQVDVSLFLDAASARIEFVSRVPDSAVMLT